MMHDELYAKYKYKMKAEWACHAQQYPVPGNDIRISIGKLILHVNDFVDANETRLALMLMAEKDGQG